MYISVECMTHGRGNCEQCRSSVHKSTWLLHPLSCDTAVILNLLLVYEGVRVRRTAKRDTLLNCSALKSIKCYQRMKNCAKSKIELLHCLYTISGFSVHKRFNLAYEQWFVLLNLDHYLLLWNSSAHFPASCCLCNTYCICLIFWTQISILWTTQRLAVLSNKTRQKISCCLPDF